MSEINEVQAQDVKKSKLSTIKQYGLGATVFAVAAPAMAALDTTTLETEI